MSASSADPYDALKLENQLCFPLYACARQLMNAYTPFLKPLGLSYTQYITLMVLWEEKELCVKELGRRLFLDSGTLTPVLKSLEKKGLVSRSRCQSDERMLLVSPTQKGWALREDALKVPSQMAACFPLHQAEAARLHALLWQLLPAAD